MVLPAASQAGVQSPVPSGSGQNNQPNKYFSGSPGTSVKDSAGNVAYGGGYGDTSKTMRQVGSSASGTPIYQSGGGDSIALSNPSSASMASPISQQAVAQQQAQAAAARQAEVADMARRGITESGQPALANAQSVNTFVIPPQHYSKAYEAKLKGDVSSGAIRASDFAVVSVGLPSSVRTFGYGNVETADAGRVLQFNKVDAEGRVEQGFRSGYSVPGKSQQNTYQVRNVLGIPISPRTATSSSSQSERVQQFQQDKKDIMFSPNPDVTLAGRPASRAAAPAVSAAPKIVGNGFTPNATITATNNNLFGKAQNYLGNVQNIPISPGSKGLIDTGAGLTMFGAEVVKETGKGLLSTGEAAASFVGNMIALNPKQAGVVAAGFAYGMYQTGKGFVTGEISPAQAVAFAAGPALIGAGLKGAGRIMTEAKPQLYTVVRATGKAEYAETVDATTHNKPLSAIKQQMETLELSPKTELAAKGRLQLEIESKISKRNYKAANQIVFTGEQNRVYLTKAGALVEKEPVSFLVNIPKKNVAIPNVGGVSTIKGVVAGVERKAAIAKSVFEKPSLSIDLASGTEKVSAFETGKTAGGGKFVSSPGVKISDMLTTTVKQNEVMNIYLKSKPSMVSVHPMPVKVTSVYSYVKPRTGVVETLTEQYVFSRKPFKTRSTISEGTAEISSNKVLRSENKMQEGFSFGSTATGKVTQIPKAPKSGVTKTVFSKNDVTTKVKKPETFDWLKPKAETGQRQVSVLRTETKTVNRKPVLSSVTIPKSPVKMQEFKGSAATAAATLYAPSRIPSLTDAALAGRVHRLPQYAYEDYAYEEQETYGQKQKVGGQIFNDIGQAQKSAQKTAFVSGHVSGTKTVLATSRVSELSNSQRYSLLSGTEQTQNSKQKTVLATDLIRGEQQKTVIGTLTAQRTDQKNKLFSGLELAKPFQEQQQKEKTRILLSFPQSKTQTSAPRKFGTTIQQKKRSTRSPSAYPLADLASMTVTESATGRRAHHPRITKGILHEFGSVLRGQSFNIRTAEQRKKGWSVR